MARTDPHLSHAMIRSLMSADGRIAVRVTPNARHPGLMLVAGTSDAPLLNIRVSVPPEDGKANEAVIALLAKALQIRKSAVTIVQGHSSRNKIIAISG